MHAICRPRSPKMLRRNQHYMANHIKQKNCEKILLNWAKTSSLLWTLMDPQKGCTRLWFAAKPLFPGVVGPPPVPH